MKILADSPDYPPLERRLDGSQVRVAGRDDREEDDLAGRLWDLQAEHWRAGMRTSPSGARTCGSIRSSIGAASRL